MAEQVKQTKPTHYLGEVHFKMGADQPSNETPAEKSPATAPETASQKGD